MHATGYATLDEALGGGLRAGVYLLAAPPAVGKTALATQAAWHIAHNGQLVIYLATGQTRVQLLGRRICSQAGLNVSHFWRRTREFRAAVDVGHELQPLDTLAIASDEPHGDDDRRGSIGRERDSDPDALALELHVVRNRFGPVSGRHPVKLRMDADTGTILDGDGQPCENHPPALAGFASDR